MDRQWANAELLIEQLVAKVKVLRWVEDRVCTQNPNPQSIYPECDIRN